ncbi:MAG: RDD family protein [Bacteroidetes bacterium]|nr:RDD family protein [Bacteroidota bacterium]
MSEDNYSTPDSGFTHDSEGIDALASKGQRFLASMVDGLIGLVITFPIIYFTGGFKVIASGVQPSFSYTLFSSVVGILAFSLVHGMLLVRNGQTVGKKFIGIKIVDLSGNLPTITSHLLPRYAVFFLLGLVPVVGIFIFGINILFIFGKQRRCIHDYIAGTRVVVS